MLKHSASILSPFPLAHLNQKKSPHLHVFIYSSSSQETYLANPFFIFGHLWCIIMWHVSSFVCFDREEHRRRVYENRCRTTGAWSRWQVQTNGRTPHIFGLSAAGHHGHNTFTWFWRALVLITGCKPIKKCTSISIFRTSGCSSSAVVRDGVAGLLPA